MNALRQMTLLAVLAAGSVTGSGQSPHFTSTPSELVVLPVTVTDKQGRLLSNLTRDQFTVYDNDRPQSITAFSGEDTAATIGLVIDNSSSMASKRRQTIDAALAFATLSHPDDQLFVVDFNDTVHDGSGGKRFLSGPRELERALSSLVPQGRTSLYSAILAALDHAGQGSRARKALIVMSDGGDNASSVTLKEVLARSRSADVAIYTIGLFDPDDPDRNPGVLDELARASGGRRFLPASPDLLLKACEQIAREISSSYTIGYVPTAADGKYHRLRVTVETGTGGRLQVRTRPGYTAALLASED